MHDRYEQLVAVRYVLGLARATRGQERVKSFVVDWIKEAGPLVGIDPSAVATEAAGEWEGGPCQRAARGRLGANDAFERARAALEARAQRLRLARPSGLERNIGSLAGLLGFDPLETALLGVLVRFRAVEPACAIYDWWRRLSRGPGLMVWTRMLGWMLGAPRHAVAMRLAPEGRLVSSGLITIDNDGDLEPYSSLVNALQAPVGRKDGIADRLLGAPSRAALEWADFDHVAEDRDHVLRVLQGALARNERGVHVLLYGPPGTGKTELCRTLAVRLGVPLYAVGEADEEGHEPSRGERLAALRLAQRLIPGRDPALLLFDEVEDLFEGWGDPGIFPFLTGGGNRGSKVYLHRLLETAPVPTLWTTNSLWCLGPAVIRRMTCAVELGMPLARVRARVWRRELARNGITLADSEVDELARRFEASPALAASAARSARLSGGCAADVRRTVESVVHALGRDTPPERCAGAAFAPELANADLDLGDLVECLSRPGASRAFSLCLFGPPGTGKSLFVRHLAERMALEVMERRASDLLSMWVGETEKCIARAFAEARRRQAFLVFDEADSLLGDRRGALHSWEVSQVNEMLTWMECHELPFACTTNLAERLDEASLRRFTFRVRLNFLTGEQARLAFRRFFGLEPPEALNALDMLAPGDFAVVQRRAALLGLDKDAGALVAMLGRERAAKPGAGRPIGFAAQV